MSNDIELKPDASLGDMLRSLVADTGHLFRTEIRLAKSELRDNLAAAKGGAIAIAIGIVLLLSAVFTFLGACVGFLTPLVGPGWAALIVTVVTAVIGIALVMNGSKKIGASSLAPDRTLASLKQDAVTLKGQG